MRFYLLCAVILTVSLNVLSQAKEDTVKTTIDDRTIEGLKYKQQPGLALAASKIFFSDKRYSISGFGETNFVSYLGPKNTAAGDLELYYTNLYRWATFFGYRFSDKIIWNSEFQIEYLHDGSREGHYEIVIEAFMDFLIHDAFKMRFGFYPLPIGYVNSNDEPVMFYSVNRSDVERIITPSTWIELGAMFYGNITDDLAYTFGVSQGLNASNFIGGTWIRQGREITLSVPSGLSFNPQLIYTGIDHITLSASGYFGPSGQDKTIDDNGDEKTVNAPVNLGTGYVKYEKGKWRFISVGVLGSLGDTPEINQLTQGRSQGAQVLGRNAFGYLFELGYDFLSIVRGDREISEKSSWYYDNHAMKLPVFIRYERLNTHASVHPSLTIFERFENDLDIWTIGANYNLRENIVIKANYQFRNNRYRPDNLPREGNRIEFGIGFIY